MTARIELLDGALAVRIPVALASATGLAENALVDLSASDGQLHIRPVQKPRYKLEELLAQVTDENIHGLVEWGPPVGGEVW